MQRLREAAEKAKCELSSAAQVNFVIQKKRD
jgi:molecular chaperone DnaK (HSP70)